MLWSVWQGIHLPMKLRFGKEAFMSCCITSTFEWWLPNNGYLTLLLIGWLCKTLLPDCLYNEISFEHWISEDLRTPFPFSIFWHEHLKIKHKNHRSLYLFFASSDGIDTPVAMTKEGYKIWFVQIRTESHYQHLRIIRAAPCYWINQYNSSDTLIYSCQCPVYSLLINYVTETSHL